MGLMQASPVPESYAGPLAWWEPGESKAVIIDRDMAEDEVLVMAGLDWTVSKRQLIYPTADAKGTMPNPDFRAIARDSDDQYLGTATPTYQLFQNHEGVTFVSKVLDQAGGALKVHTAGSLYDGRIAWILAKFDEDLHVKGDGSPIESYFLALWGHDGRHALQALNTNIRVWCGNTAAAAIGSAQHKISIRHTKNMGDRIEEVRRALDINFKYRAAFEATMNKLALREMTVDEVKAYTAALYPANPNVEHPYATLRKRDALVDLYVTSPNLRDVPETAYRAYQATVEYLDHGVTYRDTKRGAAADNRAMSLIEGTADVAKARSLALLVKA